MGWVVRIADDAQAFLDALPPKTRRQLSRSVSAMERDPFQGDVQALHGTAWKGFYRKRSGAYRIIFFPRYDEQVVDVAWIVARSEKAYR